MAGLYFLTCIERRVYMDREFILSKTDHTLLKQETVWRDIKQLCDEAVMFKTASVCIPPSFVSDAKEYMGDKIKICTVIGFPNGYMTTRTKVFETTDAIKNGADEIDMVVNIGDIKDKRYNKLIAEISEIKSACESRILKVIIETCLLSDDEKARMCEIVSKSGADYIKTSTGFSTGGATFSDIELLKKYISPGIKIKAAGGIKTFKDAEKFINLGADRLGTSRLVKLAKELPLD